MLKVQLSKLMKIKISLLKILQIRIFMIFNSKNHMFKPMISNN